MFSKSICFLLLGSNLFLVWARDRIVDSICCPALLCVLGLRGAAASSCGRTYPLDAPLAAGRLVPELLLTYMICSAPSCAHQRFHHLLPSKGQQKPPMASHFWDQPKSVDISAFPLKAVYSYLRIFAFCQIHLLRQLHHFHYQKHLAHPLHPINTPLSWTLQSMMLGLIYLRSSWPQRFNEFQKVLFLSASYSDHKIDQELG